MMRDLAADVPEGAFFDDWSDADVVEIGLLNCETLDEGFTHAQLADIHFDTAASADMTETQLSLLIQSMMVTYLADLCLEHDSAFEEWMAEGFPSGRESP